MKLRVAAISGWLKIRGLCGSSLFTDGSSADCLPLLSQPVEKTQRRKNLIRSQVMNAWISSCGGAGVGWRDPKPRAQNAELEREDAAPLTRTRQNRAGKSHRLFTRRRRPFTQPRPVSYLCFASALGQALKNPCEEAERRGCRLGAHTASST